jgi:IS66 C-terminal element/Transposase IS66 family
LCWAHARRQFFELADIAANARRGKSAAAISPIALEAVKRIDALFDIERGNDVDPQAWLADVLARINDHAIHRLEELLPWNWALEMEGRKVAA